MSFSICQYLGRYITVTHNIILWKGSCRSVMVENPQVRPMPKWGKTLVIVLRPTRCAIYPVATRGQQRPVYRKCGLLGTNSFHFNAGRLSNSSKVTELVGGRARIWTQVWHQHGGFSCYSVLLILTALSFFLFGAGVLFSLCVKLVGVASRWWAFQLNLLKIKLLVFQENFKHCWRSRKEVFPLFLLSIYTVWGSVLGLTLS